MDEEINKIAIALQTETDPIRLVDWLTKLAGYAATYEGLLQPIQMEKPIRWLLIQKQKDGAGENREKPLSDKKTEMTWATTEEGQKELLYTSKMKQISLMSQAIRQNLYAKKIEFRNLNPNY